MCWWNLHHRKLLVYLQFVWLGELRKLSIKLAKRRLARRQGYSRSSNSAPIETTYNYSGHSNFGRRFQPYAEVTCEMILKLFQCFISHVTTFEIIWKLFQPLKLFQHYFSNTEHVGKYPWVAISLWNDFEIKFKQNCLSRDIDEGWNNFEIIVISHVTTALRQSKGRMSPFGDRPARCLTPHYRKTRVFFMYELHIESLLRYIRVGAVKCSGKLFLSRVV